MLFVSLFFAPAAAAAPPSGAVPVATTISIMAPSASALDKDIVLEATLRDVFGQLLASQHLTLTVDGKRLRSDLTDAKGKVRFVIGAAAVATAGRYSVAVVFEGSPGLGPTTDDATVTVLPAAIEVRTVPPTSRVRLALGPATATTGPDGVAALPVPKSGSYQLRPDLTAAGDGPAAERVSFVRWLDGVYTADRHITVRGPARYVLGLQISYRATIEYVDLDGQRVDPSIIEQAQFSTGTGTTDVRLNDLVQARDVWWTAVTATRRLNDLVAVPITYRLLSAQIHGADVVYRGQQAWTPTEGGTWTIQLLLYQLTVRTQDALLGGPVAAPLQLVYPDGTILTSPIGADGTVAFPNLPRGEYQLKLTSGAISPPTPVALSRPQLATLKVITYLDVAITLGALMLVLLVLMVVGRRSQTVKLVRRATRRTSGGPLASSRDPGSDRQA